MMRKHNLSKMAHQNVLVRYGCLRMAIIIFVSKLIAIRFERGQRFFKSTIKTLIA